MRKLIENCISSISCLSKPNPASHNKFNLNNCMQVISWHHQYCEYLKFCNFLGDPPHFVRVGWTPWKLSILDVFQRYLKWRNTFDTLCLNFFYILDGPISVDLHQVKFQDNSNILRYFVNLKHIWQCQRLSQKHKEMLPKLVFRWKNP